MASILVCIFSSPDNTPEFHDEIEEALRDEENNTLNKDNKMQNVAPTSAFSNLEEPMDTERIDIEGGSPPMYNLNIDIDNNNNGSEEKASSSSDSSDSDSDSDSSDNSGSDRSTHSAAGINLFSSENLDTP
jgi:hypothetical protein